MSAGTPLHRLTVFLTYRCNLRCSFCKTVPAPRSGGAGDFTFDGFARLLDAGAGAPIRHLHLTRGEAPLLRDAPAVVRLARERGVPAVSVTSGGALAPSIYERLVDAGLTEIRISMSACDPGMAREVGGVSRAWERAMRTIESLARLRHRGCDFHLVLNTLVSSRNRERLPELIRHMIGLGADDVKLIPLVQERRSLGDFESREGVVREVEEFMCMMPQGAFPLLRHKLRTIFPSDAVGLQTLAPSENPSAWRCFVTLTERTVDSERYYPCSVYSREGGSPLGRITEPADVQRRKLTDFVRNGRCLEDAICCEYCLNCTREFNALANRARCWRAASRE